MALNTIPNEGLTRRGFTSNRIVTPVIINGGFEISQRSETTATSFVNNTYGLDRWLNYLNGSCALNYQQLGPTNSIVTSLQTTSGQNFSNALFLDCTTAASLASTDLLSVLQKIEGYNHNILAGKTMTLSFFVRSNRTGTFCVAFKQGSAKTYVVEYTIDSANTWEQKTITITNDTLANYNTNTSVTNGSSLQLNFTLRLGTTSQQTTANAWNSGNFYGTSNQTTWGTSTDDVFYLSGCQLELGSFDSTSVPSFPFESFENNLRKCQRYYYERVAEDAYGPGVQGMQIGSSDTMIQGYHPIKMRAAPSMSVSGTWSMEVGTTAVTWTCPSTRTSTTAFSSQQSAGNSDGSAAMVYSNNNAASAIIGDAEL